METTNYFKEFEQQMFTVVQEAAELDRQEPVEVLDVDSPGGDPADTSLLTKLFKWNDLADLDIHVEWLLDGLIPKGAISTLFCPGGGGKTWLMMQIARAIATGETFGDIPTEQAPVYFVDFENPLSVVKERREKIGAGENFYYWHLACDPEPPKLDSDNWVLYKELPPGLLIFDTLRASHSGDENSSKDMAVVLARLKELRELGFTIVILHHTPKASDNQYKGSTAILDLVDHALGLERLGKSDDNEFDPDSSFKFGCRLKTRFEPNSIFLTFDPAYGFTPTQDPDLRAMEKMRDILEAEGVLNTKSFVKEVTEKFDWGSGRIKKLIKKGTGSFWKSEKGERNSWVFRAMDFSVVKKHPYRGVFFDQLKSSPGSDGVHTHPPLNTTKNVAGVELAKNSDPQIPFDQLNSECKKPPNTLAAANTTKTVAGVELAKNSDPQIPFDQLNSDYEKSVTHYLAQGLSLFEAKRMANYDR